MAERERERERLSVLQGKESLSEEGRGKSWFAKRRRGGREHSGIVYKGAAPRLRDLASVAGCVPNDIAGRRAVRFGSGCAKARHSSNNKDLAHRNDWLLAPQCSGQVYQFPELMGHI